MNAVGIDVSKGKSMMAALRPMGEIALRPTEYPHTPRLCVQIVICSNTKPWHPKTNRNPPQISKKESPDTKFVQGASGPPCICPEIPKRLSTSLCRQPCTRRRCLFVRTQKPLPNTIDLCGRSERMSIGTPKNLPATFLRIYPPKRDHLHIRSSPCITKQK